MEKLKDYLRAKNLINKLLVWIKIATSLLFILIYKHKINKITLF